MNYWRTKTSESLSLIHDNNTAVARRKGQWETLLSGDVPPASLGQDRRVIEFPLNATIRLADSAAHLQLQLADIVAGVTATMTQRGAGRSPKYPDYVDALWESPFLKHILIGGVWPSNKISPEELDTEGPVLADTAEYIASLLSGRNPRT